MAGIKGMIVGCVGLTDKQVWEQCEKQYTNFCIYRSSLASRMPDHRNSLFMGRKFDGNYFLLGNDNENV